MSSIEELKELVAKLALDSAKRSEEDATNIARMTEQNARLIEALANRRPAEGLGGVVAPAPDPAVVRSEKLARLGQALRKSTKVKDFSDTCKIREWLRRFDRELVALKKMYGIAVALQRNEWIDCIGDKLEYSVITRLETWFKTKRPVITWANVTKIQIETALIEEYGKGETDVSAVLCQFGPNRLRKAADMSVAKFYHLWQEQLPECMLPEDNNQNERFVDLVKRSLFYFCLDDKYLQEQLCQLKGENLTLKMFMDEACAAELKRK